MLALAFLIISSIVGAGFATGAELLAFFGKSNLPPILISLFVGVFLMTMMSILVYFKGTAEKKIKTENFFRAAYFIFFIAMTAGLSTLSGATSSAIALALCIAIVLCGFDKLIGINKYLTAFVLCVLFIVGILNLGKGLAISNQTSNLGVTIIACILYAGLNCCMLDLILSKALSKWTRKEVLCSCVLGTCIVCFFVMLILTAIRSGNTSSSMPVLSLSNNIITTSAIFFSIFTSMYICLFNIAAPRSKKPHFAVYLVIVCVIAYVTSFFGFTNIIGALYPLIGFCMTLYIAFLIISYVFGCFFRRNLSHQNRL